jgi:hypothetical protein
MGLLISSHLTREWTIQNAFNAVQVDPSQLTSRPFDQDTWHDFNELN